MRKLVPDPSRNAILTCRWSSTGYDGACSNTAAQHAFLSRQPSLDADLGGRNGENNPSAITIPYVKPSQSVCPTPRPALKSP